MSTPEQKEALARLGREQSRRAGVAYQEIDLGLPEDDEVQSLVVVADEALLAPLEDDVADPLPEEDGS